MAINPWKFTLHPAFNRALVSLFSTSCRAKAEGHCDRTIHSGGRSVKRLVFGRVVSALIFLAVFFSFSVNASVFGDGERNDFGRDWIAYLLDVEASEYMLAPTDWELFPSEGITLNT